MCACIRQAFAPVVVHGAVLTTAGHFFRAHDAKTGVLIHEQKMPGPITTPPVVPCPLVTVPPSYHAPVVSCPLVTMRLWYHAP